VYTQFLAETKDVNRRIFIARKLDIELIEDLPRKISSIASLSLLTVGPSETPADKVVVYASEPPTDRIAPLEKEFQALEPATRYRGKFALLLFRRWLDLLVAEFTKPKEQLFEGVTGVVRAAELTLSNFASKSSVPNGLEDFLNGVAA
jgi:hypothetical protein